jgi:hypothetical protein
MNNQQVFNTVVQHLLSQREASETTHDGETCCAYRGDGGLKCAIGALIPDEIYKNSFEGQTLAYLLTDNSGLEELFDGVDTQLLFDLQNVHDGSNSRRWELALRRVGLDHSLSLEVFNEPQPT